MTAPITRSAELVRRRGLGPDCIRCIATNVTLCRMNKKRKERWLYTQIAKVKEELDSNGGRAEKDRSGIMFIISVLKLKQDFIENIWKGKMRYKYKVTDNEGKVSDMEAMSFKKLRRKLDHKQNYVVEYTNKKGNPQHKINVKGIEPK